MRPLLAKFSISIMVILLFSAINIVFALPYNWTLSNAGDNDEYFIRDETGTELSNFLIQLIEDANGNGLALPDVNGNPQGDDLLLTSFIYDVDVLGLPPGVFSLSTMLYTEVTPFGDQTEYYIRIFNDSDIGDGSFYSESFVFHSPATSFDTQTEVIFNKISGYYIGNVPPVIADVEDLSAEIGDILQFNLLAADDEPVEYACISNDIPGGLESIIISPLNDLTAQVQWQIPIDAQGTHTLLFTASDGQFIDTVNVNVNVTDVSGLPTAFKLISPSNNHSLFNGKILSWGESLSPTDQNVLYNLYWALDEEFLNPDSIVNLDTLAIHFVLNEGSEIPGRTKSRLESFEGTFRKISTSLDEFLDFSPDLAEGTRIYWKIKSFHAGTDEERWSLESFSTYLESPDYPSASVLLQPTTDDTIRIATPEFNWTRAIDPDMGDVVSYDLIYTTDNFGSFDTIKAIPDTFYNINSSAIDHEQNAEDIYSSIWGIIEKKILLSRKNSSSTKASSFTSKSRAQLEDISPIRDNFVDDNSLAWWVEAVDTYPLRTSSDTSYIFIEIPEHPEEFSLVFPANDQLFPGPREITLQWTPSFDHDPDDNVTYDVLITWDEDIINPEDFDLIGNGITQNRYTYSDVQDDSILKWTVRAISGEDTIWAGNDAETYNTCYFSRVDAPSEFNLISPSGRYIGDEPVLVWSASNETDLFDSLSYSLLWTRDNWTNTQRIDDITDTTIVLVDGTYATNLNPGDEVSTFKDSKHKAIKNKSSQLDEFENGEIISWKVIASDTQGHEVTALPEMGFSFTIDLDDPPLPFSLIRPYSEELIFAPSIEFKWESTTDPDGLDTMRYQVQIADNGEFNDMMLFDTVSDTSIVLDITDWNLGDYWWRVQAMDETGSAVLSNTVLFEVMATEINDATTLPEVFTVRSLYPNPFNSTLNISFAVPEHTNITLNIFDILGREVSKRSIKVNAGYTTIPFDFSSYASGVYFIQVKRNSSIHSVHKVYLQK